MPVVERPGMELRDYLAVVGHRKWLIGLATVLVAGAALLASLLQTPVYEGATRVLIQPNQSVFSNSTQVVTPAQVRTEIQVLASVPIREAVEKKMGSAPAASASEIGDTQVIIIKVRGENPRRAAEFSNAYADAYIDYRRKQAIDGLLAAGQAIQTKVEELRQKIEEFDARNPRRPVAPGQPVPVSAERNALESQRFFFEGRLDQLNVDISLKNGGSQLVAPAGVPTTPVRPTPMRDAVLGAVLGLILGTALAFVFEHLDDTIKGKEDLERASRDLSVIGVIPLVPGWKNRGETRLVSRAEPNSTVAEAYRTLRTSVQFLSLERSLRTLQITSANAGEGKSTTIANLAVALAQAGLSVIIVSCDLRRPRLHEFFGLSNAVGFSSVVLGTAPLSSALQDVPGYERLRLLSSGPLPPNPSELLAARRTVEVMSALRAQADIVLVDTPPVLPVTDAAVFSARVEGTLVVATAGSTTKKAYVRTLELLRQVNAPLVGVVLNGASAEGAYGYTYEYYAEEIRDNGDKPGKRRSRSPAEM